MKTSGHLVFYISENEDFELWRVLSQFSPDDRAAFIKHALKKAVATKNDTKNLADQANHNLPRYPLTELTLEGITESHILTAEEKEALNYFDHELTEEQEKLGELDIDDLLQSSESGANKKLPGLNFLLNNVIGEEDDEKVIEFIRSAKTADEVRE